MDFDNFLSEQRSRSTTKYSKKATDPKRKKVNGLSNRARIVSFVLIAVLLSVAYLLYGNLSENEHRLVDKKQYQAVFLESGQVYFGKIKSISDSYITLTDIFYLRVSSDQGQGTSSDQEAAITKLGCELHGPQDKMIINKTNVSFWENINGDENKSQVLSAINEFKKQNPKGQSCATPKARSDSESPSNTKDVDKKNEPNTPSLPPTNNTPEQSSTMPLPGTENNATLESTRQP